MEQRSTIIILRVVGSIVIAAALAAFIAQARSVPNIDSSAVFPPLAEFVLGGGIGTILFGMAALLEQRKTGPAEIVRNLSHTQAQLTELSTKVDDLGLSVDRLARARQPGGALAETALPHAQSPLASEYQIGPLKSLLQEIRDISLLTDEQRGERSQQLHEQRKLDQVRRAVDRINARDWARADQLLAAVEAEWPGDAAAADARNQLDHARSSAEVECIAAAEAEVESQMSLSHWDEALAAARKLTADFPGSGSAMNLLVRVQREKGIYIEMTVQRLYEDIRTNIERRVWRQALLHANKLIDKFPDHAKSERIRQQLKTIQDNAEIEERQAEEVRIGELIRARRFHEAIQLSEDLLRRFPTSPQAEAIETMLPRIQQLAAEDEAERVADETAPAPSA